MSDAEQPQETPPESPVSESGGGGDAADVTTRPAETDDSAKTMGMLAHLLAIPFCIAGFLGPLIIWLMKKDEMPFADDQGKEALNFQLMMLGAYMVSMGAAVCTGGILSPLVPVVLLLSAVFSIIGGLAAKDGKWYRYPFNLRLIK